MRRPKRLQMLHLLQGDLELAWDRPRRIEPENRQKTLFLSHKLWSIFLTAEPFEKVRTTGCPAPEADGYAVKTVAVSQIVKPSVMVAYREGTFSASGKETRLWRETRSCRGEMSIVQAGGFKIVSQGAGNRFHWRGNIAAAIRRRMFDVQDN